MGLLYRRLAAQKGKKTATKAVARKLAVLLYTLVRNTQEYNPQIYEKRMKKQEDIQMKRLTKMAKKMGYTLSKIA